MSLWFLIPLVAYSHETRDRREARATSRGYEYTSLGELLRPFRSAPQQAHPGFADIQAQLPVLALVFAVGPACPRVATAPAGAAPADRRARCPARPSRPPGRRLHPFSITCPRPWRFTQYPYRLVTYGDLLVVGLFVLGLASLRARPRSFRRATVAVAAIALLGTVQAVAQDFGGPSWLTIQRPDHPHSRDLIFAAPGQDTARLVRIRRTSATPPSRPRGRPRFTHSMSRFRPPAAPATR